MQDEAQSADEVRRALMNLGAEPIRHELSPDGKVSFEVFSLADSAEMFILYRIFENGDPIAEFALFKAIDPDRFIQRRMDQAINYLNRR